MIVKKMLHTPSFRVRRTVPNITSEHDNHCNKNAYLNLNGDFFISFFFGRAVRLCSCSVNEFLGRFGFWSWDQTHHHILSIVLVVQSDLT